MATIICQNWSEYERGWGSRPDGLSLHKSEKDRVIYCKEYWSRQPTTVPNEYSKEDGSPYLMDVNEDDEIYKELMNSKNGIHVFKIPESLLSN